MKKIFTLIILIVIIKSCQLVPTDNEKKIIGAWTIEKVENSMLGSEFHVGFMLSFTKKKVFQPRYGKWEIHRGTESSSSILEISSSLNGISGKYEIIFLAESFHRPHKIYLKNINQSAESYYLQRIEDNIENF